MLAPWIISNFPAHRVYTEVFGGGASVLLRKQRSYSEVYNDLSGDVVNVFKVVRDHGEELTRRIELTPFSREEFETFDADYLAFLEDPIERARVIIFRSFAGFGSGSTNLNHATGFRCNSNRSGTTPAHDWANYPKHISAFIERLKGVVIENKDAKEVLLQHDTEKTLHYVDPPYVHSTRKQNKVYPFEMIDQDHIDLSESLKSLKGMVVLSGYDCDLYQELYGDWYSVSKDAYADGAQKRVEKLWLNPSVTSQQNGFMHLLD